MHPLHDYVATQLADKLKSRRVVVWYDREAQFRPFVNELLQDSQPSSEPVLVMVSGTNARLTEFAGSMFEVRATVEPHVSSDIPESIVIYLAGCERDRRGSVLMELEKAGTTWEPQLK